MDQLLEIAGSYLIGMFIILIGLNLNMQIQDSSRQILQETINQRSMSTAIQLLEYDMNKLGYNVAANKIIQADSSAIKFKCSLNNNGVIDSVYYYTGSVSDMASTANPNDKQLFRKVNTGTVTTVAIVTRFVLTYSDSSGSNLSYASLSSQPNRNKIRTIRSYVKCELGDKLSDSYLPIEWRQIFRPKNF